MQHSEVDQEKPSTKKTGFSSAKLVFSEEAAIKDYLVQNILFKSPVVESLHEFALFSMVVVKFLLVYLKP